MLHQQDDARTLHRQDGPDPRDALRASLETITRQLAGLDPSVARPGLAGRIARRRHGGGVDHLQIAGVRFLRGRKAAGVPWNDAVSEVRTILGVVLPASQATALAWEWADDVFHPPGMLA